MKYLISLLFLSRAHFIVTCYCSYTIDNSSCSGSLGDTGEIYLRGLSLRGPLTEAIRICKSNLAKESNISPQAAAVVHDCAFKIIE